MAAYAYSKHLDGETPPSAEEIRALWEVSTRLYDLAPWTRIRESAIFAVEPEPGRLFWGHVMGQLGQVLRAQFYEGAAGFSLVRDLLQGHFPDSMDTFVRCRFIYVDFELPNEVERADQQALSLVDAAARPGARIPVWRVVRKNRLPWFPTADEARLLAKCLESSVAFLADYLAPDSRHQRVFDNAGAAPAIHPDGSITLVPFPGDEQPGALPAFDEAAAARIGKLKRDSKLSFELGCFAAPFPIAEPGQREAIPHMALCMDRSMHAYPPVLEMDMDRGEQLVRCLIETIEGVAKRPNEILVKSREDARLIAPFCERVKVPVYVSGKLPAISHFRSSLGQNLGRGRPTPA